MAKTRQVEMTSGNLLKNIVAFSIPLMLSGVLQLFYNAADLIVCSAFGEGNSTAAITSTNSLTSLIINLFMGLSVGSNVLMARCYGMGDKEKGQRVAYTAMIFAVVIGIFVGLFGFLFTGTFLKWMGTTSDVIADSTLYLKIYFAGLPFSMVYNFGASIMRATGDTKRPFAYLAIAGVANVLLNLVFVIVFKMNVAGVALATITAQAISATLVVVSMCKNKGFFHFHLKEAKFHLQEAKEIAQIGLPAGVQGVLFSISNVLIQSSVNSLGTQVVDGNGASHSLEGFVYTVMNSIAQACVAFVSANYGAGNKQRINKIVKLCSALVVVVSLAMGGIILLFHKQLLALYVKSDEAIEAGTMRLFVILLTYFIFGLHDVFAFAMRGMGHSTKPMIVSLCGICGLRLVWIFFVFPLPQFNNLLGIVISYPITWIVSTTVQFVLMTYVYKKLKLQRPENLQIA